jgi:phosphopantetheinyl transferase (holo-ACP synthase)
MNNNTLSFGSGNSKLSKSIATFSLPAGHSCPFAKECFSKADRTTGKIIDGKHCKFRCFAASQEALYPSVRNARWRNFEILKNEGTVEKMTERLQAAIPKGYTYVRVHVSGDFYSEKYFLAWLNVAMNNPLTVFYGYTKALPFLTKYRKYIPHNFRFTASRGGTCDNLIGKYKLRSAEVVFSVKEAEKKGLEIDHDDSHAIMAKNSFALLLHGTQPAGSEAGKAWQKIQTTIGGYGKGTKRHQTERKSVVYITVKNGKVLFPIRKVNSPSQFSLHHE